MNKEVLTVFVSQPMHGRDAREVAEERCLVKKVLDLLHPSKDVYLIDQYSIPDPPELKEWPEEEQRLFRLSRSIGMMHGKNLLVVFSGDTITAKGCIVEYAICQQYGLKWTTLCRLMNELKETDINSFRNLFAKTEFPDVYGVYSPNETANVPKTLHTRKFKSFKELMEEEHAAVNEYRERVQKMLSTKSSLSEDELKSEYHKLAELVDKINYIRECLKHALEPIKGLKEED